MREATCTPYVKKYAIVDGVSTLMNPIKGRYSNDGNNRRNRRTVNKRIIGNHKGTSIVISPVFYQKDPESGIIKPRILKYKKVLQRIRKVIGFHTKTGKFITGGTKKVVNHSIPLN